MKLRCSVLIRLAGKGAVLPGATFPLLPPPLPLSLPPRPSSSRRALFSRRASGQPHHLRRPFAYICIFPISSHLLPFHGKPWHMMMVLHCYNVCHSGRLLFSYSISLAAPFTSPPLDLLNFSLPLSPSMISPTQKRRIGQGN